MDLIWENNSVILTGTLDGRPTPSHETRGARFYRFPLAVERLSGAVDVIRILAREEQLAALAAAEADRLCVEGELRSFNNRSGEGAKLVISVLARTLRLEDAAADENRVQLRGALCRPPRLRRTPMGRVVCGRRLVVHRRSGRSDYLPCICWGLSARQAEAWPVGAQLRLAGRIQSRDYVKMTADGPVDRTAYEVSAAELERLDET